MDGGDLFQGTWPINRTAGRGSVAVHELLGADAVAVGNHEFDYGGGVSRRGALESSVAEADFGWLSANIFNADGTRWEPDGIEPWILIERGGVRVGVIGLTTSETPQATLPANVEGLEFRDVVATVAELLPEVRAASDVVVVVGHLTGDCPAHGYLEVGEGCRPDGELGRLLTELPRGSIDVIVAGHAHGLMSHRVDDTFVLENRSKGGVLGRVRLSVGPDGVDHDASTLHSPWPLTHAPADPGCIGTEPYDLSPQLVGGRMVAPSRAALALVESLEAEAGSLCERLGCSEASIPRDRQVEAPAGNLVADAMRAFRGEADLAVQNSGGIRADLPKGELRREHVQALMPFENRIVVVELTGAQLWTMLRIGSSGAHGLLQVSGASYRFDPRRTAGTDIDGDGQVEGWETDRLCEVQVGGEALDLQRTYRVVTSDFLYGGGDHLSPVFAAVPRPEHGPLLRDVIEQWITAQPDCLRAPALGRIAQGACR